MPGSSRTKSELLREALRFYVDTRDVRWAARRDRVIALMDKVQHRTRGGRPGDIRKVVREAVEAARRGTRRASACGRFSTRPSRRGPPDRRGPSRCPNSAPSVTASPGFFVGLGITVLRVRYSVRTGVVMVVPPPLVAGMLALTVAMCLTASFVSVRKALRVDPMVVFRS